MLVSDLAGLMEVGIGLSLSFAVLERVRKSIRTSRAKKTELKLESYEGSTEHREVVGNKLQLWTDRLFSSVAFIELVGVYLCAASGLILLCHLVRIGFYPELTFTDIEATWYIIVPALMMPILLVVIYSLVGIASTMVAIALWGWNAAAKSTKKLDAEAEVLRVEKINGNKK